jgi:endoglucanase
MLVNPAIVSISLAGTPLDDLRERWVAYKVTYVSSEGRVIDYRNGSITSSEGQAYGLVRALWMDDRPAFDALLAWTRDNLQGGDPGALPAWKWGQDGERWGVLDRQPASDADQLIIWALIGASRKWAEPAYEAQARLLLDRFWVEEVQEVAGAPVVLPGPWASTEEVLPLNPSYFLPFVWRELIRFDPDRPWQAVIDQAYVYLAACRGQTGLAMDWCYVDRETGWVTPPPDSAKQAYGFEAMRVPWMLAAEVRWHDERRARALLGPYHRLLPFRPEAVMLPGVVGVDGKALVEWEYPGMYGALLPVWALRRPLAVERIAETRLDPIRGDHGWGERDDYYGQNWIWFGVALWKLEGKPV